MYRDVALQSAGLWLILSLAVGQLTDKEKLTIITLHNKLRSEVKPSAAFMQKVVWAEELRLVAESYASKCIWNHNPDLEDLKLGENLFVGTGLFNATKAVMDWFGEHVDYDYESNGCPDDKMCGHYTQVVWADSFKIGCATHLCDTLENLDFKKATILVCNYYPAGNVEGQKPYESGEPCSKCPDNLPVCENNTCVLENHFQQSEKTTVLPTSPRTSTEPITVQEPKSPHMSTEPITVQEPNSPHMSTEPITVQEPKSPHMSTEPITVQEPKQGHVTIKNTEVQNSSYGSSMQSVSAPLLMLFWLMAAFVL